MSLKTVLIIVIALSLNACQKAKTTTETEVPQISQQDQRTAFLNVLNKHLAAIPTKDLETLKRTLTPNGNMQLILPQTEPTNTNTDFLNYHKAWFEADLEWDFITTIRNIQVGERLGMAIVDVVYTEPLRDGKPYFNHMIVSYDLQKIDGQWYFIKDHASSIQKSTDLKN